MTEEQRKDQIIALIRERAGYEQRGETARVAAVDAELRRLGGEGRAPRKRAEQRKRGGSVETR